MKALAMPGSCWTKAWPPNTRRLLCQSLASSTGDKRGFFSPLLSAEHKGSRLANTVQPTSAGGQDWRLAAMASSDGGTAEHSQSRYSSAVQSIHSSPTKAVLFVTGGASKAIGWLLSESGASNTVLECQVPYCTGATIQLLGGKPPDQFCAAQTALDLAAAAQRRATALSTFGTPVVGVGATCGLISGQTPKRGDHRVWVAVKSSGGARVAGLKMAKGERSRASEDEVASQVLLRELAEGCGLSSVAQSVPLDLLEEQDGCERLEVQEFPRADPLDELLGGRIRCVEYSGGQVIADCPRPNRVYLSGSFNPLHEGHEKLLSTASEMLGREGCFELAVCNADKGSLPREVVETRVKQFVDRGLPLVLTTVPMFTQRAETFPGSTFVVGFDTAIRLINTKYYANSEVEMARQFARLEGLGCSFAVAGRLVGNEFLGLENIQVPEHLKGLFSLSIPESKLRVDISSTAIRARMEAEARGM